MKHQQFAFGNVENTFTFDFSSPMRDAPGTPIRQSTLAIDDVTKSVSRLSIKKQRSKVLDSVLDGLDAYSSSSESEGPPSPSPIRSPLPTFPSESVTPESPLRNIPTGSTKRSLDSMASTPPASPKKKRPHVNSAVRNALEQGKDSEAPKGLLQFMKKCTEEEYREQTHREFAALSLDMKEWKAEQERMKEKQQEGQREGAKARKRRERERKYQKDVDNGIRDKNFKLLPKKVS